MTSDLATQILEHLTTCDEVDSLKLVDVFNEDHQKIIGAIKSLQALENDTIAVEPLSSKKWELTEEGQYVVKNGSHEAAVYNFIPEDGVTQAEIMAKVPYAKVGFSKAVMSGWIELDKSSGKPIARRKVPNIVDTTREQLQNVDSIPDNMKKEYKKRKLLQEIVIKSFLLRKGSNFSTKIEKLEADLTVDLMVNDAWKQKKFKHYNFDALGQPVDSGHLHPLMKVRSEFRKIFIEMGFEEMPTNNFVESSFWNFDALFVPQQHPARDDHDTFFVSEPKKATVPKDLIEKVKKVHSTGGYGSQGYRYDWKIEEAQKNVLRTHTTAVSARMLHRLMQQGEFKPVKFFSIDRVFRNETLDATHLAEFHQVEGVIADYDLTLGNLIGVLYTFFSKLGITQLEFKPAYNPYTEPSMEIFCFHNGLNKWIEIGNSGVFRPELLRPLGIPENVNVIAWGLSLERPTMIKYGLNNIRDLVGPKVDLQMVHNNPICRLDKHSTNRATERTKKQTEREEWRAIGGGLDPGFEPLASSQPVSLVVLCDPANPVRFLEPLVALARRVLTVAVSVHVHSTVRLAKAPFLSTFSNSDCTSCNTNSKNNDHSTACDLKLTIIWHAGINQPRLRVALTEIVGLVNIARYFNRLIESKEPHILPYESKGPIYANRIDEILDEIHCELLSGGRGGKRRRTGEFVMGEERSVVDIIYEALEGTP